MSGLVLTVDPDRKGEQIIYCRGATAQKIIIDRDPRNHRRFRLIIRGDGQEYMRAGVFDKTGVSPEAWMAGEAELPEQGDVAPAHWHQRPRQLDHPARPITAQPAQATTTLKGEGMPRRPGRKSGGASRSRA